MLNVLILGSPSFVSTLNELKGFLKFNPIFRNSNKDFEVILFHNDILTNKKDKELIDRSNSIKICLGSKKDMKEKFDANLELPTSLKQINTIIENTSAKKNLTKIHQ